MKAFAFELKGQKIKNLDFLALFDDFKKILLSLTKSWFKLVIFTDEQFLVKLWVNFSWNHLHLLQYLTSFCSFSFFFSSLQLVFNCFRDVHFEVILIKRFDHCLKLNLQWFLILFLNQKFDVNRSFLFTHFLHFITLHFFTPLIFHYFLFNCKQSVFLQIFSFILTNFMKFLILIKLSQQV